MLRGRAFELGAVIGRGEFASATKIDGCVWWGGRAGHRFAPFAGLRRLQLGFRAGWEACLTDHDDIGRIDLVYIHAGWQFGYRFSGRGAVYWGTGLGMLLGDATPGDEIEKVVPRFAVNMGPGVTFAVMKHVLFDFSAISILFEDFRLGNAPEPGTRVGVIPTFMIALQI